MKLKTPMHLWVVTIFISLCVAKAAIIEPASTTLFILMDASGLCNSAEPMSWEGFGINDYIKDKVVGQEGYVYCHSYDGKTQTPLAGASAFVGDKDNKSIFDEALENWFLKSDNKALVKWKNENKGKLLGDLKLAKPDIVPLKYVVITEGVGGLAAREYIQSNMYQGEMENVLFFNTPHEGTGFADQALFQNTEILEKSKKASSYAEIIPLALVAYLAGGVDGMQEMMITLVKSAVVGMAADIGGGVSTAFKNAEYFDGLTPASSNLWYLAQDADMTDPKYLELKNAPSNVDELVGRTQFLNSFSKNNSFAHPSYNVIYSNGFPSIGNGRRTLDDFADRKKIHISESQLKSVVAESLKSLMDENGIPYTQEELASLVDGMLKGETSVAISNKAKELVGQLSEYNSEIAAFAQGIMELKSMKLNQDDIPGSVVKLLSIVYRFIPDDYKSEIYGTIMKHFSSETASAIKEYGECAVSGGSIKECALEGSALVATSFSNYSLNFFDEGTFDVPAYSAFGENVKAFKESGTSRFGYELASIVEKDKTKYQELAKYQELLSNIGKLEKARKTTDLALSIGCDALDGVSPACGKICRAAEFAVNVGLITGTSLKLSEVAKNSGALKETKYIALKQSVEGTSDGSVPDRVNKAKAIKITDLDKMLFGEPRVSIYSVQHDSNGAELVVPMMFNRECNLNVRDYASICKNDEGKAINVTSFGASAMQELDLNSDFDKRSMSIKKNSYVNEKGVVRKRTKYYRLPAFEISDYIEEFRFQIDDLQPDSLYLIKLDFNARIQFAYERSVNKDSWDVYVGVNNSWELVAEEISSPVTKDGLFVFDPEKWLDMTKDKILLGAMEEDGANVVNVVVVNKIGRVSNQQFSYMFRATALKMDELWPRNFDKVSEFDEASIHIDDYGYDKEIKNIGLRIAQMDLEARTVDSLENIPYELVSSDGSHLWKATADLKPVWSKEPATNGTYLLEWDVEMTDKTKQQLTTVVYVDVDAPKLKLTLTNNVLNGRALAGKLGYLHNLDSIGNRSIRAIRGFIASKDRNIPPIEVFRKTYYAGPGFDVVPDSFSPISMDGEATFYIQAYDFANPNRSLAESLRQLETKVNNGWDEVLENDGRFKMGINDTTLETIIFIDNTAPKIADGSLKLNVVSAPLLVDSPKFDRLSISGADYTLNVRDTLKIGFNIEEPLYDRDSSRVLVDFIFRDEELNLEREYSSNKYLKSGDNSYLFEEPEANRLRDGIYKVLVRLKDEAGNVTESTVINTLKVDRTPPVVSDVFSGGDAFESVDDISKVDVLLSQSADLAKNRSDLKCFAKLNMSGMKTAWMSAGTETMSKELKNDLFAFNLKSMIPEVVTADGKWLVYVGCYDAVGNYGQGVDFFGMGKRYPQITFPTNKNNEFYNGKILVAGVAPNPVVRGDDNVAGFEIRWKADGDKDWKKSDLTYLEKEVSLSERNLAVWDASNLENGTYLLQIRVRGCPDENQCDWVSTEEKLVISDALQDPSALKPRFVFTSPENQTPGVETPFEFELANADSKSKWAVNIKIEVQSPQNPETMVAGMDGSFDPMIVSPFAGEKAEKNNGLTIWQDADATWNLYWKGHAEGIQDAAAAMEPALVLKYLDESVSDFAGLEADSLNNLERGAPSIRVDDVEIPAYNRIKKWMLGGKDVHVKFKTDSSFIVDLSSVEGSATRICYGIADSLDYVSTVMDSKGVLKYYDTRVSPVVYVHPNYYKAHFKWNGLTETGLYPGGTSVVMNAFIYNKENRQQVYFDSRTWNLKPDKSKILAKKDLQVGEMYIGLADSSKGNATLARQNIGLEYGIAGKSAFVTAKVLNSRGDLVRTLTNHEYRIAGSDASAYYVSWDGISENGFAVTDVGRYKIRLVAADSAGNPQDSSDYEFELKYAGNLVEAPHGKSSVNEFPTELLMDEAELEMDGGLRFVGRPDYLLKADVQAKMLPEEDRVFRYRWDIGEGSLQYPTIYEKNRFSLGIHRTRDKATVTVAALVASYGYDWKTCSNISNRRVEYLIRIKKMTLHYPMFHGDYKDEDYLKDTMLVHFDPGVRIIAHDNTANDKDYEIQTDIKVFPESAFESIKNSLGGKEIVTGIATDDGEGVTAENFWESSRYTKVNTYLYRWYSNFNETLYWESAGNHRKHYHTGADEGVLNNSRDDEKLEDCITDAPGDDLSESDAHFVCGTATPGDEENLKDFNPHRKMLAIEVVGFDESNGKYSESLTRNDLNGGVCDEHDKSGTALNVNFRFYVRGEYLSPSQWGINNLFNRYVRFDAMNKTLYSSKGYMNVLKRENRPTYYDGRAYVYPADSGYYGYATAFESQKFVLVDNPSNPLLFADELGKGDNVGSNSEFSYKFFGKSNVKYRAMIKYRESNTNEFINSEGSSQYNNPKLNSPYEIASVEVAPVVTVDDLRSGYTSNKFKVSYPYKGGGELPEDFDGDRYKFYGFDKWVSRIHYGIRDWTSANWNLHLTTNKRELRNPVTNYQGNFSIEGTSIIDYVYRSVVNGATVNNAAIDDEYTYEVKEEDSKGLPFWSIPFESLKQVETDELLYEDGSLIDVKKVPVKVGTSKWEIKPGTTSTWEITNEGVDVSSTPEYVLSWDESFKGNRPRGNHSVELSRVTAQNPSDLILGKSWIKNINVSACSLFVRDTLKDDGSFVEHPYFNVNFKALNGDSLFNVTRTSEVPLESRINETATIRGRVPGDNVKWKLLYTKKGMLFTLDTGTQVTMPHSEPYPILTTFEMNRLQGNTSFFLTYGGEEGATYFRQMNVHVGELVDNTKDVIIQSMYENVSVKFPAYSWESPVDVTVRTISKNDYNFNAFKGLATLGPVVEVLPSHKFPDNPDFWPEVHVILSRATLKRLHIDPSRVKIYKPDFETGEIVPLETHISAYLNENNDDVGADGDWVNLKVSAKTPTFSTFFVMDEENEKNVELVNPPASTDLVCYEMKMDTLWMGISNGWLEYPYPCSGKSNYALQLKSDSSVAAEHQGASASPIVWNARKSDIYTWAEAYNSRVSFYGDSKNIQMRGPVIFVDSVKPDIDEISLETLDEEIGRKLRISMSLKDVGSGINQTQIKVYFAGTLIESRTIEQRTSISEYVSIDRKRLHDCIGCKATVEVYVEDKGHNHVKESLVSEKLYPYPSSLVLWYPLIEGAGLVGNELMGSGLDMDLSRLTKRWVMGNAIYLWSNSESATSVDKLAENENSTPFTLEFTFKAGYRPGVSSPQANYSVISFDGPTPWTIGIQKDGRYYMDYGDSKIIFSLEKNMNTFEHIFIVVENSAVSIYKDGKYIETKALKRGLDYKGAGRVVVGNYGDYRSASGYIKNIRLYSSALSEDEIAGIHNGVFDLDEFDSDAAQAVVLDYEGLIIDQSCSAPGTAYLRQKVPSNPVGRMTWNANVKAGLYSLYLLTRNYTAEESKVEVFRNGSSLGLYSLKSTGLWNSQMVNFLTLDLSDGENRISVRPIGDLGVAGIAVATASKSIPAEQISYGESEWKSPDPKVNVMMNYESADDVTWARTRFQLRNISGENLANVKIRYYYSGEGENVQAVAFYPYSPMNVVHDAGSIYYAEFPLTEPIAPYGTVYYGNGPLIGIHRTDKYFPWYINDDPSYVPNAEKGFVKASGVALLDENGNLLNDWACHDEDGAIEKPQKQVRVLAKENKVGSTQSTSVSMYVENVGSVAVDGFEVRYYYRDEQPVHLAVYDNPFAKKDLVNVGGDLNYVSFIYENTILNPGEKSDFGNGVHFELFHDNWVNDFNSRDDPSHYGLGYDLAEADSILVLDRNGNLLWGGVPQPNFGSEFEVKNDQKDIIHREGDVIYVKIDVPGNYVLEVVNAMGAPQTTLFNGNWFAGEHSVTASLNALNSGSYIVLRSGNQILSWQILN